MTLDQLFNIVVVIFTVANLMAGGLDCDLKTAMKWLVNPRLFVPTLFWGWVIGPVLALTIVFILPLQEGPAAGLILVSLAPIAPFLPLAAAKAKGDLNFSAAYILLASIATVILMPVMSPILIKGLTLDTWALAKPLLIFVLIPLVVGVVIKTSTPTVAGKISPLVKRIGGAFLLLCLALTLWIYARDLLNTIGSFAPLAWVIFMVVMAILPYGIGMGLKQNQRSVMALGMTSRNISAGFVAFFGISNPLPGMFAMVILVVPLHVIIGLLIVPRVFAKRAIDGESQGSEADAHQEWT